MFHGIPLIQNVFHNSFSLRHPWMLEMREALWLLDGSNKAYKHGAKYVPFYCLFGVHHRDDHLKYDGSKTPNGHGFDGFVL
jgi:hypothetical protein